MISENLSRQIAKFLMVKQEQLGKDLKYFLLSWSVIGTDKDNNTQLGLMLTADTGPLFPEKRETVCLAAISATKPGAFAQIRKAAIDLAAAYDGQYEFRVGFVPPVHPDWSL